MIEYALLIAGVLCLVRLVLGPTVYDRVVAADAFLVLLIAVLALWAQKNEFFIDIAIVFGALSFGATLVFSKYLRGEKIWS
ncbi:MAG TPA: cation:proton antiporter [Candidatus Aenigmarchaeota archaeon]|nr:cation:proton antiporter [Candidatus Aenigmarchaeota archaeon]